MKNGEPTCLHRIKRALKATRMFYGRSPASEFGPTALKVIRQYLVDQGLSRRYVNELTDCVRRMFKWAAAEELVPAAVPQALYMLSGLRRGKTTARETAPVTPVDERTVAATLPHLSQTVRDMVEAQRLTGMRPAEVCAMRPMDLEQRSDGIWVYQPASHKTEHHGRHRAIAIGPRHRRFCRPISTEVRRTIASVQSTPSSLA